MFIIKQHEEFKSVFGYQFKDDSKFVIITLQAFDGREIFPDGFLDNAVRFAEFFIAGNKREELRDFINFLYDEPAKYPSPVGYWHYENKPTPEEIDEMLKDVWPDYV